MTDPVAHGMPWSVIPVLRNVGAAVQFRATACYLEEPFCFRLLRLRGKETGS